VSALARRRIRAGRPVDEAAAAEVADAIRSTVTDPETWRIHTEDEILEKYARRGFELRSLEDIPATVHNAAVYGHRAGAAEERAHSFWLLADALALTPEDRRLPGRDDPEAAIRTLAHRLARAKAGAGLFTGVRPVFGEFNSWYVSRVARDSCRAYRERTTGPGR
jgi:hypothetical protein